MTRFAIIGVGGVVGSIGPFHRAAIERLEKKGRARLVAVADPMADRMPAQKAELEGRGVRWHMDYRGLLENEKEVDAVVIATPIPFHYEMAEACIARGFFINLEKPPVPLIHQLESLIAIDASRRVSVGFQLIGSRCVQALKALIVEGKIGEVREIRGGGCWPRLDNYYSRANWAGTMTLEGRPVMDGPATNAFAHLVHNIMFLAAPERHDFAIPVAVEGELYRARRIESYDVACLRGRFAAQIEFSVAVTHATQLPLPYRIEVRGTRGWARLSNDGTVLETSCGIELHEHETTQQLIDRDYDQLIDVIEGRQERFSTRLKDTRGYVSATNGMFISSGGIHDIDPDSVRRGQGEAKGGYDVLNLRDAVQESLHSGKLFSEQNCSWALARPATISLEGPELGRLMAQKMGMDAGGNGSIASKAAMAAPC